MVHLFGHSPYSTRSTIHSTDSTGAESIHTRTRRRLFSSSSSSSLLLPSSSSSSSRPHRPVVNGAIISAVLISCFHMVFLHYSVLLDDASSLFDETSTTTVSSLEDLSVLSTNDTKEQEQVSTNSNNDSNHHHHHDNAQPSTNKNPSSSRPTLGRLRCEKYGGPSHPTVAAVDDLVYWYDIPSDATYLNPFQKRNLEEKGIEQYLLFQQDAAGFNNRRMSLETLITMGISMGRTIVLPPEQPIYMFRHRSKKQKYRFSFEDFFHLNEAHLEHVGVNIITMSEFLTRVMNANADDGTIIIMKDPETGLPTYPPGNRTDWNHANGQELKQLHSWLEDISSLSVIGWETNACMAYWPDITGLDQNATLERIYNVMNTSSMMSSMSSWPRPSSFDNAPIPVNASVKERFGEQRANRPNLCLYNATMQNAQVLYFKHTFDRSGNRFLSPFYTFHFYEDWHEALWMRRFVRDHLRYHNELMCAAARVIDSIRNRVRQRHVGLVGSNHSKDYDLFHTMHIRRGDFILQYKNVVIGAELISQITQEIIEPNSTIFIATDEKNKTYFEPLAKHYDLCFLDDFAHELKNVNANYFGIIDQIVASRGDVFIGTWFSTLSAYVNRLRGYYSIRDKLMGYEKGALKSFYFSPPDKRNRMRRYFAPQPALWAQEFPMAWRDIDHDVNMEGT